MVGPARSGPARPHAAPRPGKTDELISTCAAFRIGPDDDSLAGITRLSLRELAQRIRLLETQLERVVAHLTRITKATAPEMIAAHGVGPDTASTLRISAGDNPHRLHSESSWAAPLGSNPIPASSGKTNRHRLNRGGDRQANAALRRIAIVRMRSDPNTRTYIDKRIKEGKSKTQAIRCLKRYVVSSTPSCREQPSRDSRSIAYDCSAPTGVAPSAGVR